MLISSSQHIVHTTQLNERDEAEPSRSVRSFVGHDDGVFHGAKTGEIRLEMTQFEVVWEASNKNLS